MRVVSAAGVAFFAWFSVDAAALLAGAALARANDCSIGYRELGGVQGLPQVREHVCVVSPGGARRTLRVTFARLDEQLAGNLALGEKTPELDQLFSGAIFVANEVSAEVKLLFQKFAHKVTVPARNMELTVSVGTPRGGETIEIGSAKLPSLNPGENETRRLWSISSSDATVDRNSEYGISMQNLGRTILRTTSWPDGFMQFYSCQEEAIQCTRIWRYVARLNELDAIERETDRRITAEQRRSDAGRDKSDWGEDSDYVHKTHFSLFRHLAERGWPERFLVIQSSMDCVGGWEVSYLMPSLALDAAIIENTSSDPVQIQDIVGVMDRAGGLRAAPTGTQAAVAPLNVAKLQVAPGGKVIMPLRITFFGGVQSWGTMSDAEKMYQRIASKPSNAMFTLIGRHGEGRQARIEFQIRKTKSSFKSPEVPERGEYRFGPQLHLSGFLVDTQNFNLDKREPNLITLNGLVSSENDPSDQPDPSDQQPDVELSLHQNLNTEGSCPILYVWDEVASEWVNRGKVIHTANHEDKETTSLVSVSPKARRFRLAEEELEVAFVRRTQLLLTLRDGQRISIDPSEREGAQFPRKISAYRSASFNYSVPEAYVSAGIARAELAVTGFYTRYSTILASRLFKPNPRPRGRP